ncbi:hypothetical protein LCGC14_2707480, partial [marine sediment metagenome]
YKFTASVDSAKSLIRPKEEDLFR